MQTTAHKGSFVLSKSKSIVWVLPESLEPDPLVADITEGFAVATEQVQSTVITWFDTFDWRLYQRGLFLYCDEMGWNLLKKGSAVPHATVAAKPADGTFFAWDFPGGRIRSVLEPVLEMRCLMPLVTHESSTTCLRILNKDDKTVARVFLVEHKVAGHNTVLWMVRLEGVRGYAKNFRELEKFFRNYGIRETVDIFYPFTRGVELCGRQLLDYHSRFEIKLMPDSSARVAMIAIYRQLLEAMQSNQAGVLEDLDSEFLHDFRVAIRRTRSGLGQVKKVLPKGVTDRAKRDFAWLGRITGPTRDLDVYLLGEMSYRARLPASLQKGLDTFFASLREQRVIERRNLVHHLQSEKFRQILNHWQEYLDNDARYEETVNSAKPVIEFARDVIFRKYGKVIKDGNAITSSSPDEHLHRLRIECKKLRYILEFFSSLFPQQDMKQAIKLLKRLQTNLGDFNDLSVQQDMLRDYLASLRPGSRKNQELSASLGGLLTNLYHEQHRIRRAFATRFSEFSTNGNAKLYKKLFEQKA